MQPGGGKRLPYLEGGSGYPVEHTGADAEERYANGAHTEGDTSALVATEGGQRTVGLRDIHRLDDEQVVVETHYRIDERDEHHEIGGKRTLLGGSHEDEKPFRSAMAG